MLKKKLGQLRYIKNPMQIWRILTSKVKSIEIAVNFVCNKKCPGCYARNLREEQKNTFLNQEDMKEICKKYKPAHINITGGEPMLNPHILGIVRTVPQSIILSMVTNGDMFIKKEKLKKGTLHIVDMDKLQFLKYNGLNSLQISYGSNYNMLQNEILAFGAKEIGLNICLSVTNVYKERDNIKNALKICEENGYHLLFNTPGIGMEDQFDYQTYFTYRNHPLVREDNMFWNGRNTCPAGVQKFYITADKSIYPCDRMHNKKYKTYEKMRKEFKGRQKVYCRRYEDMTNG